MIDDAMVEKAKISGSNFFWSFKAKKDRVAQIQHETTLKIIEELKPRVAEAEARLSDAKRGREEDDDGGNNEAEEEAKDGEEKKDDKAKAATTTGGGGRAKKLARLFELGRQKVTLEKELEKLKENDPAALADLEKELTLVTQAAHRWTDNIFECKGYLVKKRGMEKKEACKFLQISVNFDCTYCTVFLVYFFIYLLLARCRSRLVQFRAFFFYFVCFAPISYFSSFAFFCFVFFRQIPRKRNNGTIYLMNENNSIDVSNE